MPAAAYRSGQGWIITAAIAPPADRPAIYTRAGSTLWLAITSRVIPAISEGSPLALLVTGLEPVPAPGRVRTLRLDRIRDDAAVVLGERVHPGARREIVGVLRATVQHHEQWQRRARVATGHVEFIGALPRVVCIRPRTEMPTVLDIGLPGDMRMEKPVRDFRLGGSIPVSTSSRTCCVSSTSAGGGAQQDHRFTHGQQEILVHLHHRGPVQAAGRAS
jgi:hypothetical protein